MRDDPPPRRTRRVPLDRRMNKGVVLHSRFAGSCRASHGCNNVVRCAYKSNQTGLIAEHTCEDTPLQRWQCALSRLMRGVMRRLQADERDNAVPRVHPELVDYETIEQHLLDTMTHTGTDPDRPVVNALDWTAGSRRAP